MLLRLWLAPATYLWDRLCSEEPETVLVVLYLQLDVSDVGGDVVQLLLAPILRLELAQPCLLLKENSAQELLVLRGQRDVGGASSV